MQPPKNGAPTYLTKPRFHRRELWQNRSFCKETVHRVKHHTVVKSAFRRRFCARKLRSALCRSQRFRTQPLFRLALLRTRAPARSQQQLASSILLPRQQLRSLLARGIVALSRACGYARSAVRGLPVRVVRRLPARTSPGGRPAPPRSAVVASLSPPPAHPLKPQASPRFLGGK